jgi:tight adherence protein B
MPILVASLTFLVVVGTVLWIAWLSRSNPQHEQIRRRLDAIEKAKQRGGGSAELDLLRDELLSDVPALHRLLAPWIGNTRIRNFIAQSGLQVRPGKIILLSAVLALGAYLVVRMIASDSYVALATGVAGGLAPAAFVAFKRWRRLRDFEKNFPEAVDLLGRAVRAGHAFTTGLEMIAKELPEPVSTEFRIAFEEQNFGLPLKDALMNFADRVPLLDVRFFVVALVIQKETGGNLAEILDNLSHVIRERFKIYGDVRVKTAHGRMTAGVLMALPPSMMFLLNMINPDYTRLLFNDPWGNYMLAGAAIMQISGCAMLWKIVQIEV